MGVTYLDDDGQVRLEQAKRMLVKSTVDAVLKKVLVGVNDRARWTFLYNDLGRRLREWERRQKKGKAAKKKQKQLPLLPVTPKLMADARRHEEELHCFD